MVSILLATYNGEKYLALAIESVLNQSFKNFELLIGFNGTTDNSREIPPRYNDPRVKIFDYEEKGKSVTLNKLLLEAKYDWIALQDDDDFWIYDKLEKQLPFTNNFDVIGTLIKYIDKDGHGLNRTPGLSIFHDDIVRRSMLGLNQVANTSAIFKKSDAIGIDGWREGLDGIEDYDFWLRLMRGGKRFINLPDELVNHRLHDESKFNTKKYDFSKIL